MLRYRSVFAFVSISLTLLFLRFRFRFRFRLHNTGRRYIFQNFLVLSYFWNGFKFNVLTNSVSDPDTECGIFSTEKFDQKTGVADSETEPDPHWFWPAGSGSVLGMRSRIRVPGVLKCPTKVCIIECKKIRVGREESVEKITGTFLHYLSLLLKYCTELEYKVMASK